MPTSSASKLQSPHSAELAEIASRNAVEAQKAAAEAQKSARYLIQTPLSLKGTPEQLSHPDNQRILLQVCKGPVALDDPKDSSGKRKIIVQREEQTIVLYRGQGFTDNMLAAWYLQEQWPELTITPMGDTAALSPEAAYQLEIDRLAALKAK